jgi:hypothetical protein
MRTKMDIKITLIFTPLKFYSNEDEDLFFEWIKKISCVKDFKGIGRELHVYLTSNQISFNDFKNFNGLFKRYKLKNSEQLKVFMNDSNKDQFIRCKKSFSVNIYPC